MTYKQLRYRRLRAAGMCGQCGKIKARQTLCSWCRELHATCPSNGVGTRPECKRAWRARRRQQGLCTDCGEPSQKFARCEICRGKRNGARASGRRAPKKYKQSLERELSGGSSAWSGQQERRQS